MKKKIIVGIAVCISLVVIITGMIWGIHIYQREQDPNWQLAQKLYNVESAWQEIDESWELKSLTQVTPLLLSESRWGHHYLLLLHNHLCGGYTYRVFGF